MKTTYEEVLKLSEPPDERRILLFDGHSLAYRSYYAIRGLTTRSGLPVNAVFGFWRALLKTLREYPSAYCAVVFDAGGITFRHELYPAYKATRKPIPEDLASQLPLIERLLAALGIPALTEPGVEADDVIASIARRAADSGMDCLIVTSDKDLAQLVDERISLIRPTGRGKEIGEQIIDPEGVKEQYGVDPDRIVDLLALVGDASDNVPGVPGVGEKTAKRLLREFGSLDRLLEGAKSVSNVRIRENLRIYADDARRARSLIKLKSDIPIGDPRELCRLRGIDREALGTFFNDVEFKSALNELALNSDKPKPEDPNAPEYHAILDEEGLETVVRALNETDSFAIDLETTGLDPMEAEIVGIAISPRPYVGYYIPVGHDSLTAPAQLPLERVLDRLRPFIEGETPHILGQNIKYDLVILMRYGLKPRGIAFDTMIASHLVHPEQHRHNLTQIAEAYLGHTVSSYAEVAGKDVPFASVPIEAATAYAAEDAEIVQRLRAPLTRALSEAGAIDLFERVEIPLVSVLARMERNGILVDTQVLARQGIELRKELEIIEADLMEMAGEPFNPSSPKQVAEILFDRLGLPVIERTKTGPSTSARVLAELAVHHPLPGKLIAYRELKKLLTTYIDQLPKAVNRGTGRIHTTFHQTSTATGRLSSSEPNLQNIPVRTDIGGRIRRAFIAPPDHLLVSADYSQIELRILAHFSGDERLIAAFESGEDLHRLTASHLFGVPKEEIDERQRNAAKRINFGIIYGISPYGLARDLGITQSEAKGYIDRFFAAYPKTKEHIDRLVNLATERGYAETLLGRRRPLPHLTSRNVSQRNFDRRNAVNTPIQGSAADLIKLAMIRIDRLIEHEDLPVKMLLQIHDELIFEIAEDECEEAAEIIKDEMENVLSLRLPLEVKITMGKDWSEI